MFEKIISSNSTDSHQVNGWVHVVVLSFSDPRSFKSKVRSKNKKDIQQLTFEEAMKVEEINISEDVLSFECTENKSQYLSNGSLVLSSAMDYSAKIHAGDHIMVWMGNDPAKHEDLKTKLANGEACNGADSGLKFIGKVNSVRVVFNQSSTGIRMLRYAFSCSGFSEFSSSIYFNRVLSIEGTVGGAIDANGSSITWLNSISSEYAALINGVGEESRTCQGYLRFWINVFLGGGPKNVYRAGFPYAANRAFYIPKRLYQILGGNKNSTPAYNDILHRVIGIQNYGENSYYPQIKENKNVNEFLCDTLHGSVLSPAEIYNSTVWSQIEAYRNPEINEVYTSLRMNSEGRIFPHFIARQIPFNTDKVSSDLKFTKYSDLPVWHLDNTWPIFSFNIGTSDVARFNFFHAVPDFEIASISGAPIPVEKLATYMGNINFYDADIYRHGPRNKVSRIQLDPVKEGVSKIIGLKNLIDDWYRDGHLKFNGQIESAGIPDPICVGDNLKVSNKLFHIEQVTHRYVCSDMGIKTFTTSISISRGIDADAGDENRLNSNAGGENG